MKKRLLFVFFALFLSLILFNDGSKEDIKIEEKNISLLSDGTVDDEVDLSIPRENASKPYKSNIPDSWYDASINHGILEEGIEGGKSFVDLISLDGTTNYNSIEHIFNDKILIEAEVGDVFGFYLEVGYINFYRTIYDDYSVDMVSGQYDLVVTNSYYDTTDGVTNSQVLFSSVDEPDVTGFLKGYSGRNGYGKTSLIIDSDARTATRNPEFRLDKFEFTATNEGITEFYLRTTDSSNGYNSEIRIIIHITNDIEYNRITYGQFGVVNSNHEGRAIGDVDNQTSGTAVIDYDFYQYELTLMFNSPNLYYNHDSSTGEYKSSITARVLYSNISLGSELEMIEATSHYLYTEEGYDFSALATIIYEFKYITSGDVVKTETIVKNFNVEIKFLDRVKLDIGISLGQNVVQVACNKDYDLSTNMYPSDIYEITYTMDGLEYNSSMISFNEVGTNQVTITVCEILTGAEVTTTYTFIVVDEKDYYQAPKFDCGTITTIDVETITSTGLEVNISNYEYLNKNATINLEIISGALVYEFFDSKIYISSGNIGANKIKMSAIYGNNIVSSILTVNITQKYKFALDKTNIEMDPNSTETIRIGYIVDGVFAPLNQNRNYSVLVSLSDDETSAYVDVNNNVIISSGSKSKELTGTIVIMSSDTMVDAFTFSVTIGDIKEEINAEVNFVEGNTFRLLLNDKSSSIVLNLDPIISNNNYDFNWLSLNNKVATVLKTDDMSAKITPTGVGITEVIAICQTNDGSTITARATIIVIDSIPEVFINVDSNSDSDSALTIYDLLKVSVNNNGFNFSQTAKYQWYLDDELITTCLDNLENTVSLNDKQNEFYLKLNEGIHSLKVVITDNYYEIEVISVKEINISPLVYQDRMLSFAEEEIYLLVSDDTYKLEVLLDGVISNEYTYLWSIDDNKVAAIEMSSGAAAIIKALAPGETIINAFVNIGKYEDRIIRAQIKIIVEKLDTISFEYENEFNKPGNDVVINVLVNGKKGFKNFNPNIVIKNGDEVIDYEYKDSKITIKNAKSGNLKVSVVYELNEASSNVEITAFNIKEFILIILPYLVIALVVSVLLFAVLRVKNNPFKKIQRVISKLDKLANKLIDDNEEITDEMAKKIYSKLLKSSKRLSNSLQYYYDEGIDEFKYTLNSVKSLIKILDALIHSPNSSRTSAKVVINNLRNVQIKSIIDNVNEIINSRIKYEENIKKIMSKEDSKNPLKKKKKITDDEYRQYLIDKGILVYDEEILDDGDESSHS